MVRQNIFEKRKGGQFIFEDDDLMEVQCMEHDAESVMHRLESKVSKSLLFMLNQQLLGFSSQMQQELAMDMVDYVCDDVMRMTGCPSADYVLEICYAWINDELDVKHQIGGIA
jgi:hypothetical protein